MIEILILSLIQGITEFLPISSSSHLILASNYLNYDNQSLSVDVSLHIGSFFAVITYFRKDLKNFIKNKDLFFKIIISSIPVMFAGYLLVKFNFIDQLRNVKIIGWATIIFGIFLYFSDKLKFDKSIIKNFTIKSAIFIGIFQVLSLIPGVSRSGITITAARLMRFKRLDAAKLSFLFSIPTLGAVALFGLNNLNDFENFNFTMVNLIAIFFSYIFSIITIKYFLKYIKKFSLNIFVMYRIILGIILLMIAYL